VPALSRHRRRGHQQRGAQPPRRRWLQEAVPRRCSGSPGPGRWTCTPFRHATSPAPKGHGPHRVQRSPRSPL